MHIDKYSTIGYDYVPNRTAWRNDIIYDIEKLWKLTDHIEGEDIAIERLMWVMNACHWSNLDGIHTEDITDEMLKTEQYISARDVLAFPKKYRHHSELIKNADLSYPILLVLMNDQQLDVIDGIHRLSKALTKNQASIKSIVVPEELLQKAIVRKK